MDSHGTPSCTNGQFATLASRIITALPKAIKLTGRDPKVIINHTNQGERLSLAIAEAINMLYNGHEATVPADADFIYVTEVTIPAITKRMDPKDFFEDSAVNPFRILSSVGAIDSASEASFAVFRLMHNVHESDIAEKLKDYDLAEWYHFAVLAENQVDGNDGPLTTNGRANIFHVRGGSDDVFVFGTHWKAAGFDKWETNEYLPEEVSLAGRWRAGSLVFLRLRP